MKKTSRWFYLAFLIMALPLSGCSKTTEMATAEYVEAGSIAADYGAAAESFGDLSAVPGINQNTALPVLLEPQAGLLTAGEWNDNEHFDFLKHLMAEHEDWQVFAQQWDVTLLPRIAVEVKRGEQPCENVRIDLISEGGAILWTTRSDNRGKAWVYKDIAKNNQTAEAAVIRATFGDTVLEQPISDAVPITFQYPDTVRVPLALDLMFVIDTTGSMGDELEYLKKEMEDVIYRVAANHSQMSVRLSVNVYRDIGDDYVVRPTPFTTDIQSQTAFLAQQSAAGGGDYEEAVELALRDGIHEHDWNPAATARLLFLVLDAPPHNTSEIRRQMKDLAKDAAEQGIRIIPIASSGVDKNTEFLMRTLAAATGGTYLFLTDHSGIGEPHLEPTIGEYQVSPLNDLLVQIINQYLE